MEYNKKNENEQNTVNSEKNKNETKEKNLRNFENTFIYDWKKALKRVEEGRKCCEHLSKIFVEIIRIEKEYESNLRSLCNIFKEFNSESSGIKSGIISLKKNIERRCEQIKDFVNYIECEILNNTLNTTLVNHKNVFDQIKIDGIENEKIVEKTKKESVKYIENCVNAYEELMESINVFHNSAYYHPIKRIELSNVCINKYLVAKKKEYEYKNTINIINEVELKKEKRLKSILYSLESMDYKRISCIKDNIMKYLIFFTSYIRNVQYDLNNCIDIFKDINPYGEIEEYCLSYNKKFKNEIEDIIFFNNIVSWPMLIDYLNELNYVKKNGSLNNYEDISIDNDYLNNTKNKYRNLISTFFNVDVYKNFIQNNSKKSAQNFNSIYTNIFNEIIFFNKKESNDDDFKGENEDNISLHEENEGNCLNLYEEIEKEHENYYNDKEFRKRENIIMNDGKDVIMNERKDIIMNESKDIIMNESKDVIMNERKDIIMNERKDIIMNESKDIIMNESKDIIMNKSKDIIMNESKNFELDDIDTHKQGNLFMNTDRNINEYINVEKKLYTDVNFERKEKVCEENDTSIKYNSLNKSDIDEKGKINENEQDNLNNIYENSGKEFIKSECNRKNKYIEEKKKNENINFSTENNDNSSNIDSKGYKYDCFSGNTDDESDYSYSLIKNLHEKKKKDSSSSVSSEKNNFDGLLGNVNNNLKKMGIFFHFYLKNLFMGNFDKISEFNITKYFNVYNNRFVFCECLIDLIKKKRINFIFLKSIVLLAKIILIFLDYCNLYVDYWSSIYILIAAENFYFEIENDNTINVNLLLQKYSLFEKKKNSLSNKNIDILNNKKTSDMNLIKNTKEKYFSDENGNSKNISFNTKNVKIFSKVNQMYPKSKSVINIYECNKNEKNELNNESDVNLNDFNLNNRNKNCIKEVSEKYINENVNINSTYENMNDRYIEDEEKINVNTKNPLNENDETYNKTINNTLEENIKNETSIKSEYINDSNDSKKQKIFLHKFLYSHNFWNNIKFWEVSFLVIISEIIQEIILLEKLRYENKESLIKKYFFFFKYFNFYNSMIHFGLSINQIGLLLNKIFHYFNLKNDPISRKYFFQIIDIATNKNITLNYIKMDVNNINTEYKKYYLQHYNNFLNDENKKTMRKS
ncbi:conserved Plasmodium protein, unknown function [Plasmodium gallinaceum]|uniref:Uncharacterized protein n=1 Tax=Plasmodium gallinaceum TaxID=5849 RepID=A0A1J1GUE1_PLAGA|nr:conserved Plasmodium protein, unknown function [Plasmodium gallinaceum]CRG96101.1 conserved Plasmodium protein, unknown function [Plasmodium gallinaceum]